jgi:hypothetical protein
MKSSILILFLSFILSATLAHGAVILVGPGQSAQTAVDGASNGDIIRVMPGNFGDLVIVDKNLTIHKHSTTPPTFGNLEVNGSAVTLIGIEATNLTARDTSNPTRLEIVQGYYYGLVDFNATEGNFLYAGIRRIIFTGKGNMVGCDLNGNSEGGIGISVEGADTFLSIRNSHIHDYKKGHSGNIDEECIGIRVKSGSYAEIVNNIIENCSDLKGGGEENNSAKAILVIDGGPNTRILGNLIRDCYVSGDANHFLKAPPGTVLRNNFFKILAGSSAAYRGQAFTGGVVGVDNIAEAVDPKLNSDFTLASDSPCINAGPPDPQYNDRDGSRNDIGMFGGHNFIPDGRTTDKPIVLGLDVAPIAVPVGGTVTIESTGATVK